MPLSKLELNPLIFQLNPNTGFNQSLQDVILEAREELMNGHLDEIYEPMYIVFNRDSCKDEMNNDESVYEEFDFKMK